MKDDMSLSCRLGICLQVEDLKFGDFEVSIFLRLNKEG